MGCHGVSGEVAPGVRGIVTVAVTLQTSARESLMLKYSKGTHRRVEEADLRISPGVSSQHTGSGLFCRPPKKEAFRRLQAIKEGN